MKGINGLHGLVVVDRVTIDPIPHFDIHSRLEKFRGRRLCPDRRKCSE
jgi:hypothetical protein